MRDGYGRERPNEMDGQWEEMMRENSERTRGRETEREDQRTDDSGREVRNVAASYVSMFFRSLIQMF